MLDELGNLQSEGHGIANFQTMLSIGLGQDQQFTLILQTLQQLRDVYGDSVDKIVQGNTSNIVFLKSTDDSMIDTLQKMSGTHHVPHKESKNVTVNNSRVFWKVEDTSTVGISVKEEPVITYNDFAFISERNSIVLRAGDSPIWNRNQTILPMSWRLFQNTIQHYGHNYSLQTIPTLSSVLDFDVRKNQPNFERMLELRKQQAYYADAAIDLYKKANGYSDAEFEELDPDIRSDGVMEMLDLILDSLNKKQESPDAWMDEGDFDDDESYGEGLSVDEDDIRFVPNTEVLNATADAQKEDSDWKKPRYAHNQLSRDDLIPKSGGGSIDHNMGQYLLEAYVECHDYMEKDPLFRKVGNDLLSADGQTVYVHKKDDTADLKDLNKAAKDPRYSVYAEGAEVDPKKMTVSSTYELTDDFYRFLVSMDRWNFAGGRFEEEVARAIRNASM